MERSNRYIPTIDGPHDDADRFIRSCLRGWMGALLPISPTASPIHSFTEARGGCLSDSPIVAEQPSDTAKLTAVVETDEPTPDHVQEASEAQAEAEVLCFIRDDDFWYWNVKIPKCFPGYHPTDDEDIKRCIREIRERAASRDRAS